MLLDERSDGIDILESEVRDAGIHGFPADDGDIIRARLFYAQGCGVELLIEDLDLLERPALESFHKDDIHTLGCYCVEIIGFRVLRLVHQEPFRREQDDAVSSPLCEFEGVLALRVYGMLVHGMFDRCNLTASSFQLRNEALQEIGLSAVRSPSHKGYDVTVSGIHGVSIVLQG